MNPTAAALNSSGFSMFDQVAGIRDDGELGARNRGGDLAAHLRRGERVVAADDHMGRHADVLEAAVARRPDRGLDALEVGVLVQPRQAVDQLRRMPPAVTFGLHSDFATGTAMSFGVPPFSSGSWRSADELALLLLGEMGEAAMGVAQRQREQALGIERREIERDPPAHGEADDVRLARRRRSRARGRGRAE